jgi:hypothetical protein
MNIKPRYLGDAVYASFDGYHICLHLNDHASEPVVKLEKAVLHELNDYAEDIDRFIKEEMGEMANEDDDKRP